MPIVATIVAQRDARARALAAIEAGEVVAIPTETVYGLAADAANGKAVARIFEAKGRPRFNPLIAHVSSLEMAKTVALFDPLSQRLAEAFWPGPLTLVLPLKPGAAIHPLVTAGLATIALRMPRGFGAELIAALGRPLAAPSANSSGRVSATTAVAVEADLGQRIPLIVDGGPTPVGLELTIVKAEGNAVRLLRPGGVAGEDIERVLGQPMLRGGAVGVEAPGMLASHYAPGAAVRVDARQVRPGEALLAFGPAAIAGIRKSRRHPEPVAVRRSRRGGGQSLRDGAGARSQRRGNDRRHAHSANRSRRGHQRPAAPRCRAA